MARWKQHKPAARRVDVHVDPLASAADQCRAAARALAPGTTDEELVAGLREIADAIEAELEAEKVS
jgi:hypothetical protein